MDNILITLALVLMCSQASWVYAEDVHKCVVCNSGTDPDCLTTEGVMMHQDWEQTCEQGEGKDVAKGCYKSQSTLYDTLNKMDIVLTDRGCTYIHKNATKARDVVMGCTESLAPGSGTYTVCRCKTGNQNKPCNTGVMTGGYVMLVTLAAAASMLLYQRV